MHWSFEPLADRLRISRTVAEAIKSGRAVVALESTVITHGLPYPENIRIANEMEAEIVAAGATPATIAIMDGNILVGASSEQIERLSRAEGMHKISRRDFAPAFAFGWSGGTTVAATMIIAHAVGIRVFATGGIGGVHRQPPYDISADLPELARTPLVVVCAGAKAILDLDATLEYLETNGTPVVGYQTDEFPAFYSRNSGLPVSVRVETAEQAAKVARLHWSLPSAGAVLVVNPPPPKNALDHRIVERAVEQAIHQAEVLGVRGQAVTPFLLSQVSEITKGASLEANLALLRNNARLGAQIALAFAEP
ncbi:MAG: pseudouridine-5'-phosphate glycosidase [Anaerolineales bacterium]|nr:pseudouridine-5'-phosphate glycosidase [Anaerolineales bacterium]